MNTLNNNSPVRAEELSNMLNTAHPPPKIYRLARIG